MSCSSRVKTFRIHAVDAGRRRGFTRPPFEEGAVVGIVGNLLLFLVLIHVQGVKRLLFAPSFFRASKSVQCSELSLIFDKLMQGHRQEEPRHLALLSLPTPTGRKQRNSANLEAVVNLPSRGWKCCSEVPAQ